MSLIHLHCCLWSAPCSSSSYNLSDMQHCRRVPVPEPQFSHVWLFSEQFSKTFKSKSGVSPFTSRWFPVWRSDLSRKSVPLVPLHFSAQVLRYVYRLFDFYIRRVFSSALFCTVPLCTVPISLHIGTFVASAEGVTIFNSGVHYVANMHAFEF